MKIDHALYTLTVERHFVTVQGHTQRHGALLRFTFDDGSFGYADCHPWQELGDLPLADQLQLLSQGKFTPLTERSLIFATLDEAARIKKKNLFENLIIPQSHFLIANILAWHLPLIAEAIEQQFTVLKIKLGADLQNELLRLKVLFKWLEKTDLKVRLDFNLKLTQEKFHSFLNEISSWWHLIDFCEDPFPFNLNSWKEMQKAGPTLACDSESEQAVSHPKAAKVCVIKPAQQSEIPFLQKPSNQRLVITSYLDHPLGQLCAAYVAAFIQSKSSRKVDICGLMSHRVYQPNAFSEQLCWNNANFKVAQGTGLGYDELLAKQDWKPLYKS
jgi:O-succinylbenzoate synthase